MNTTYVRTRTQELMDAAVLRYRDEPTQENREALLRVSRDLMRAGIDEITAEYQSQTMERRQWFDVAGTCKDCDHAACSDCAADGAHHCACEYDESGQRIA